MSIPRAPDGPRSVRYAQEHSVTKLLSYQALNVFLMDSGLTKKRSNFVHKYKHVVPSCCN